MSVLLTVNSVSHNPAQRVLIIFPLNLQTITITQMLSSGGVGERDPTWGPGAELVEVRGPL